jgi:C-terminal processing protease CtpA/Prc
VAAARTVRRAAAAFAAVAVTAASAAAAAPPFDPAPWVADLEQAREVFATKYANLEWAVYEREADLPALFAETRSRVEAAASDADARAAFERLTRRLGDGHVRFVWPTAAAALPAEPRHADCGALGYEARMRASPMVANAIGYRPLPASAGEEFPAGTLEVGGRVVGVLEIGVFTEKGFPELCTRALAALHVDAADVCGPDCGDRVDTWAAAQLTRDLARRVRELGEAGAQLLLVDISGNGGGSEWAEAAARMLTPIRLRSSRVGFVRGEHWASGFAQTETELKIAADATDGADRALLLGLARQVSDRRLIAATACDAAPLWVGQPMACQWLGKGFYASGLLASADPLALAGKPWAGKVFSPARYPYEEGVWQGPLVVLIDGGTASAAEEFAALLQDNHAALVVGAPSTGAGCGHTDGGTPTRLVHSGAILEVPDCVRLRADGTNEVMGIQPDVLIGLRREDGRHRAAARLVGVLPVILRRFPATRPGATQ